MFGFVTANLKELTKAQKERYGSVYCGICRRIREQSSQMCRLGLSYDMAFLALLLMSLYEPVETAGERGCMLHPKRSKNWVDNPCVRYAADMNVALAYYKAEDDWQDDQKFAAKVLSRTFGKSCPEIAARWPRQCAAMEDCIRRLSRLEKENCSNPDEPANCFGQLMGELLVMEEDLWSDTLRKMGMALGRFIYLADAAIDYRRDRRKQKYNPYLAMDTGEDWERWESYLVLAMGRCTEEFERLPLVQDKALLDNILYSGIWCQFRQKQTRKEGSENG